MPRHVIADYEPVMWLRLCSRCGAGLNIITLGLMIAVAKE